VLSFFIVSFIGMVSEEATTPTATTVDPSADDDDDDGCCCAVWVKCSPFLIMAAGKRKMTIRNVCL
jgi:hypothetical protein